ncbi:MAG: inositol-3-phosphate synthase [Caldisphaera sp.]|nr:MAG: myo-inositol-1-phosphate synthase [Caldisphaera sp.]PMP90498.1 MAG: myo-inositol-1-phosphate synthase [Caldisphaera sp.]
MPIRTILLGAGPGAAYFAAGIERLKTGEIEAYGIPFGNLFRSYRPEEIQILAVFEVDNKKIGLDMHSVTSKLLNENSIPNSLKDIEILRGLHCKSTLGLPIDATGLDDIIGEPSIAINEFISLLDKLKPDIIVNIITTEKQIQINNESEFVKLATSCGGGASLAYAYAAAEYSRLHNKVSFINLTPPLLANSPGVISYYEKVGGLVFGDDAATGATPLTADLLEHMAERNRKVSSVAQFNIGGNMDFLSLTEPERNKSKENTKGSIVNDILGYDAPHYIKPTGFLEPLGDKKFVAMHIEYVGFGGYKDEIVVTGRINDKSNLGGLMASVIPITKAYIDRGYKGTVTSINRFFMKRPGPLGTKNVSRIVAYNELMKELKSIDII